MSFIKHKKTIDPKGHVLILLDKVEIPSRIGLSKNELSYISGHFKDKDNKSLIFNSSGRLISILLLANKKSDYNTYDSVRKHGSATCDQVNAIKGEVLSICNLTSDENNAIAAAEGVMLGNYQYLKFLSNAKKKKNTLASLVIEDKKLTIKSWERLEIACEATIMARDLVNDPVNKLNATQLAEHFRKVGKQVGIDVEVLNKKKIQSLQMGGLLAVNAGSVDEPTFTILNYKPKNAKNKKPIVLVGKGIVYDTGGLSLKPTANSMDMMKCDMAGAAAVGCTIYACAKAKLPVHVVALIPATDNRPGFNAFAPGDIITMMDGSTVEMLNSDAEGRMILADALHYAKRYKPELTIDVATLTGAAMAAIGRRALVGMGNVDEKTSISIKQSGYNVFERVAEMPFWDDYSEMLKSDIADQKNIGGPYAGSITAGKFLEKFTDYPYYHLDIAGPAIIDAKDGYRTKGGTGVGVRLLFDFIQNYKS
ncbi:MAG: M17 family metallopeptidase [Bacteroidia bacterium]